MTKIAAYIAHPSTDLTDTDVRGMYTATDDPDDGVWWSFLSFGDSQDIGTYHAGAPYVFVYSSEANTLTAYPVPDDYGETYGTTQASAYIRDIRNGTATLPA